MRADESKPQPIAVLLLAQATNASFLKAGGNTFSNGVAAGKKEAEGFYGASKEVIAPMCGHFKALLMTP